jgi:AraC family transcriptional regulator
MGSVIHLLGDSCLFVGEGLRLDVHTPHAFEICVAFEGRFRMRLASEAAWTPFEAAVIAPDVARELDAGGGSGCILLVGPETTEGRQLPARTTLLPARPARCFPADDPEVLRRMLIGAFASPFSTRYLDPRIVAALRLIRASPASHLPLGQIAAAVSLSPSRLVHLFREQTHISIKRYSLWLRVHAAYRLMASQRSLTEIAYRAGFADSAHLSRAFRRMLGLNPSELLRRFSFCDRNSISIQNDSRSVQNDSAASLLDWAHGGITR